MKVNFTEFATGKYWQKFTKSDFWFGVDKLQVHGIDYSILGLGVILVIASLSLQVYSKTRQNPFTKELLKRCARLAISVGLLLLVWFGLRIQNINVLGTHFSAGLIISFGLIWLAIIARYRVVRFPTKSKEWEKEQLKQKYLNLKR